MDEWMDHWCMDDIQDFSNETSDTHTHTHTHSLYNMLCENISEINYAFKNKNLTLIMLREVIILICKRNEK